MPSQIAIDSKAKSLAFSGRVLPSAADTWRAAG